MKKTLIYTAVFSVMMMVSGCGGGDDSSRRNDKENVQLDTSPIKQNKLYGANINGVPSYYIDDGQNQVSYFHENDEWYGTVENKDGMITFRFSDDLKEFIALDDKGKQIFETKQINDSTIYQTIKDYQGNIVESMAYFQENDKFFVAPLNIDQIDKSKKKDITQEYKDAVLGLQKEDISAQATAINILNDFSAKARTAYNEMLVARGGVRSQLLDCNLDEQTTDLKKTIEDLKNKIMQDSIFKPMVNVALIAGGILIAYKGAIIIGIPIAILGIVNAARASEIDLNNQQAINKLKLTNSELNEWKKFLEEAKKCQAEDSILVNGICKKIDVKFSGIYRLNFRQTSCTESGRWVCSFGPDKNDGNLFLDANKKEGILAVLEGSISGGAYAYNVKWNLDKNSIEFKDDGFRVKGVRHIMLDSNGSNVVKRDVYVDFKIEKEDLINKSWSGTWVFNFIDKEQSSYDPKNNIYYFVEKPGKATGTWTMIPSSAKRLPAFIPEISGVCSNSGYIYNFDSTIELSRGGDAVLINDTNNKSCTYYQDVYN